MRKFLIAAAALGLLAGAACSSDSGKKSSTTPTTDAGGAVAATITAQGTTWKPDDVTVQTGDTVKWVVNGSIVHDLKGDDGVSHKANSNFTVKHTFNDEGTFSYQCTIHPGMTGTITVQ